MKRFEVGTWYGTRSIGDHTLIYSYKVVGRTAKTVVLQTERSGTKRCRIKENEETEFVFPEGRYSMCPVIWARKTLEQVEAGLAY